MTIRKRIERLETKRGRSACTRPSVVFLCDAETGQPGAALIFGGGSISREPGEMCEAFKARAIAGTPSTIRSQGII